MGGWGGCQSDRRMAGTQRRRKIDPGHLHRSLREQRLGIPSSSTEKGGGRHAGNLRLKRFAISALKLSSAGFFEKTLHILPEEKHAPQSIASAKQLPIDQVSNRPFADAKVRRRLPDRVGGLGWYGVLHRQDRNYPNPSGILSRGRDKVRPHPRSKLGDQHELRGRLVKKSPRFGYLVDQLAIRTLEASNNFYRIFAINR